MKIVYLFLVLTLSFASCKTDTKSSDENITETEINEEEKVQKEIPKNLKLSVDQQIASAIMAAPLEARGEAKVLGYDDNGDLVVLREGKNELICIADNPQKDGFEVVCYHTSLEPFMSRGRTLSTEVKTRQEKEEIREAEALSGVLKMPKNPATLHIYYGENGFYNTETSQIENAKYRYVVYIPYATPETTGLPLKPNAPSHPWLMFPGKYNAHIMISPAE